MLESLFCWNPLAAFSRKLAGKKVKLAIFCTFVFFVSFFSREISRPEKRARRWLRDLKGVDEGQVTTEKGDRKISHSSCFLFFRLFFLFLFSCLHGLLLRSMGE